MGIATVHQDDELSVRHGPLEAVSVRNQRDEQQDAVLIGPHVAAVADGIGGHPRGAEAARTALAAIAVTVTGPTGEEGLRAAVQAAQKAVAALADGPYRNPGTTVVVAVAGHEGTSLHGAWLGDSRAYLIAGDGSVTCLTEDHTDLFGGLLGALGAHGEDVSNVPGTFTVAAGTGARLLLCSDGVHGPIEQDDAWSGAALPELLAEGLTDLVSAVAGRGSDNATAVLIDVDAFITGR
jgi:serine/threonine protein phosphatase PrpC